LGTTTTTTTTIIIIIIIIILMAYTQERVTHSTATFKKSHFIVPDHNLINNKF